MAEPNFPSFPDRPCTHRQSEVFRDLPQLLECGSFRLTGGLRRAVEAMGDMIMNQRLLRIVDGVLDGLELLGQLEAWPPLLDHGDHHVQVTAGALEALDDFGMRSVRHVECP